MKALNLNLSSQANVDDERRWVGDWECRISDPRDRPAAKATTTKARPVSPVTVITPLAVYSRVANVTPQPTHLACQPSCHVSSLSPDSVRCHCQLSVRQRFMIRRS